MIDPTAELRKRLASAPATAPATFIVPHTWPDLKNAEYEVLQRLSAAAINVGARMIAVDNDGYPLWSNDDFEFDKSARIDPRSVDFMICLHFESPRFLDVYSYYALWQPVEFYNVFGYEKSVEQMLTHTDCLSCRSDDADAHARNLFGGVREGFLEDIPVLFHSPPRPYLESTLSSESRLFYVGINWERINNERGRHHELLLRLNDDDLIDIYGPKVFQGVEPWRGFKTYRGELAFDGKSVVEAVNKAGICLALSSAAHQSSALMSNRLFEGLAAGAAVIANPNEFIDKYFSDIVYVVDDDCDELELYFQTRAIMDQIRANPAEARARAIEGQRRLDEAFSLERSIATIIAGHPGRHASYQSTCLSSGSVTVIIDYRGDAVWELEETLRDLVDQSRVDVEAVVVCSAAMAARHGEEMSALAEGSLKSVRILAGRPLRSKPHHAADQASGFLSGPSVADILSNLETDYVAFKGVDERWFSDHLGSLVKALDREPDADFAIAGALEEKNVYRGSQKRTKRNVDTVRFFGNPGTFFNERLNRDRGRFLYRASLLRAVPADCLVLLDGEEATLARLSASISGPLAQTSMATYVRVLSKRRALPSPNIPIARQRGYIVDALAPSPDFASSVGSAGQPAAPAIEIVRPEDSYPTLAVNRTLTFDLDPSLRDFLTAGFSGAEQSGVWIEGHTGKIAFRALNPAAGSSPEFDLVLKLSGRPANADGRRQHCSVRVNDVQIAYIELNNFPDEYRLRLPKGLLSDGLCLLELIADHADPVLGEDGRIRDPRHLSVMLHRLSLHAFGATPFPELPCDEARPTRDGGSGLLFLGPGFLAPEDDHIWLGSAAGKVRFSVSDPATRCALLIRMRAHLNPNGASSRKVAFSLNGTSVVTHDIDAAQRDYLIPLDSSLIEENGHCLVSIKPDSAEVVLGEDGRVADERVLSVCLSLIGLIDPQSPERVERGWNAEKSRSLSARFQRFLARNRLKL